MTGRRLWRAVLADYEVAEHEQTLLRAACRTADMCDELDAVLAREGALVTTRLGEQRIHPAVVELRQQRLALARLVVALRVPLGDQEGAVRAERSSGASRLQRRGLRGVYGGAS